MTLVEACCGSLDDALVAENAGVDRIELNSALFLGGLTPSAGTLATTCERLSIPVIAMIRPRGGGFNYTDAEMEAMIADVSVARQAGAAGVVFGVLGADGTVDKSRNAALVEAAAGMETVFHRALDVVPDMKAALATLIELGVTRVLTTGGAPDPWPVLDDLAELVRAAAGRIEILIGGSQPWNADEILRRTGATQLHIAKFANTVDTSCRAKPDVYFGGALYPSESIYERLDAGWTGEFTRFLKGDGSNGSARGGAE